MPVSVRYVARETGANLLRNRMMALAAILVVAVSLSLVGTSLLLKQAVSNQVGQWQNNVSLAIFVKADASPGETAAIKQMISTTPQIASYTYLDHTQSYALMKKLLDNPIVSDSVTVDETPPLFQCVLTNPSDAPTVASLFTGVSGVYQVTYPGKAIRVMREVTSILQLVLIAIAVVLLVASLVLILIAIRMAIFARRREVGVMKLVGATNWFIRVPFMLEGLVQGLLGAVVACGIVIAADDGFRYVVNHYKVQALSQAVVASHDVVTTALLILVVGALVGAVGSFLAVHRFLDV
ncbi:MAG TPA: permease-like cell division protein FtsX [Acidimicrobiales bacterium]|nr:permease-like cell division protein FtsX [Acidimicrobiales bacterium]